MKMSDYLFETKYAVENLFKIIWKEHYEIEKINNEIKKLDSIIIHDFRRVQNLSLDEDEEGLATLIHWDSYFGEQKDRHHKNEDREGLKELSLIREFSIASLSSSVLQFAKQGLSMIHGHPDNWPDTKQIGTQSLKNVIRWARNQGMHFGERETHKPGVISCFSKLSQDFGSPFEQYEKRNMSFYVLKVLGWNKYEHFERDMMLFEV